MNVTIRTDFKPIKPKNAKKQHQESQKTSSEVHLLWLHMVTRPLLHLNLEEQVLLQHEKKNAVAIDASIVQIRLRLHKVRRFSKGFSVLLEFVCWRLLV